MSNSQRTQLGRLAGMASMWLAVLTILGPVPWARMAQGADNDPFAVGFAWSPIDVADAGTAFWPQYRGPTADGHADPTCEPPIAWSESENVRWKLAVDGKAWSSPVVWGDTLWMTNATEDGRAMSILAIDRENGKIRYDRVVFTNETMQPDFHAFNSHASPTPVLDRECVYISFGAYGTAALDRQTGATLWERRDLRCNHFRGAGSSPILFRDLLIFHMDGFDHQYAIALNKRTGETVWKSIRNVDYGTDDGDVKKAFSTPQIIETSGKQLQMISPTSKAVLSYDPFTGRERWRVRYSEFSSASRALFDGERVYLNTGFSKSKLIAIRPEGQGDLSNTNVLWETNRSIGSKPSPVLFGATICSLDDRGVLSAMECKSGDVVWQQRLGGDFSSSPIVAGNRIYCFDESGKGHVISAVDGTSLKVNTLEAGCLASPAVIGNELIVRTRTHLYCLGSTK